MRHARGFTLIEVLLATVLLVAGLALAFSTLGAATRTATRGEAMAERSERMRTIENFLRTRLTAMRPVGFAFDQSRADKGRSLAKSMHCGQCHVSDFSGQNQIPRLAGQREEYLAAEMRAYRNGERTGGDTIMSAVLFGVKDPDIEALAHFLAHAPVKRAAGKR